MLKNYPLSFILSKVYICTIKNGVRLKSPKTKPSKDTFGRALKNNPRQSTPGYQHSFLSLGILSLKILSMGNLNLTIFCIGDRIFADFEPFPRKSTWLFSLLVGFCAGLLINKKSALHI